MQMVPTAWMALRYPDTIVGIKRRPQARAYCDSTGGR
jgi:hypothetical protein